VSLGFWTLNNRQKGMKLVTGLPTSNREWKDDYVFVCGENWEGLPWEEKDDSFVRGSPCLGHASNLWCVRVFFLIVRACNFTIVLYIY
jgi:hypothetical protein